MGVHQRDSKDTNKETVQGLNFSLQLEKETFPGGVPKFWKFQWGGGGYILEADFDESRGKWGHRANPFHWEEGWGMDIFWNYTMLQLFNLLNVNS